MAGFESIVQLCRLAETSTIAGTDLVLHARKSAETSPLLQAIEAAQWRTTVVADGSELIIPVDKISDNKEIVIYVHGMTRSSEVFVNNIGMLLKYDGGKFLYTEPSNFYLIQENYSRGEVPVHKVVEQYRRAIRIVDFIRQIADDIRQDASGSSSAVFLTSRKLLVPLTYQNWDLDKVVEDSEIEEIENEVLKEHHGEARKDIARRALVRLLAGVQQDERFSTFIRSMRNFRESFLADFDIYISAFNFDKTRDDFERKKLDYVIKLNAIGNDAMGKLLAIPVGQGLLASQMKNEVELALANKALLVGSFIFAVIALMILISYVLSILHLRDEFNVEVKILKERSFPTYRKLAPMVRGLKFRIQVHLWGIPGVMLTLLAVTTCLTLSAYKAIVVAPVI
ncbi:hypothetical protein [Pseudoxanthomonas sp. PXM04]|uniref:hypothetical protein n=1 Tax=Pseudoxanthomonas sp. PXM04 TaxID=2769297 RepID=UPI00177F92A4|nr:hypothetical protein [Pseudoxanthomonas sp. PXM04]MBD9377625.1 hypothetical protein [Pseudoxanthomonas sp. PXM04]